MEKRTRNQVFEFRVPRKKNNKIFWKVPSKIYGSDFIMEKTKTFFTTCTAIMLIQWDDEGNFGFSFTLGFNENYTDIFCSVTLQEKVRTVITKLFTI